MKPIFLYLSEWKPSTAQLTKLSDAGYVPVAVKSFDHVRICEPLMLGNSGDITLSALHAVATSSFSSTQAAFGYRLAKLLLEKNSKETP